MKLIYDNVTDEIRSNDGVQVRPADFGGTSGVEYLDPTIKISMTSYFKSLVEAFVKKGYQRGKSIYAAPYDFRMGPHTNKQFMIDLQNLIERAYAENGNQKVALISHSMGGLWTLYFLNQQPQ